MKVYSRNLIYISELRVKFMARYNDIQDSSTEKVDTSGGKVIRSLRLTLGS